MKVVWMKNEDIITHRFRGPRYRWYLEKKNAPRQNDNMATRDLTQVYLGTSEGNPLTPSPAKMVFPEIQSIQAFKYQNSPHTCLHPDETAIGVESDAIHNSSYEETSNKDKVRPSRFDVRGKSCP